MLICRLGDGYIFREIDILNRVEQPGTVGHGALEGLASADEAGTARALVDDRGRHGFFEVVRARCAPGVDQPGAAHVAVGDLVAGEVDRVIARKVGVDALVEFAVTGVAHVEGFVATVVFRQLLLDDVRLDRDAEVIGLTGEVGGKVIVLILLEGRVAKIASS